MGAAAGEEVLVVKNPKALKIELHEVQGVEEVSYLFGLLYDDKPFLIDYCDHFSFHLKIARAGFRWPIEHLC